MNDQSLAIFTAKSKSTIFNDGGTQAWKLDHTRARAYGYAVLCRNTRAKWAPPKDEVPEPHGSAFLIGHISDVVPSPEFEGRWKIVFDKYAEVSIPGLWRGWRNPVKYTTLEELGIDIQTLQFIPMPQSQSDQADSRSSRAAQPMVMTIEEAKQKLAASFGVKPEAVEITIRG